MCNLLFLKCNFLTRNSFSYSPVEISDTSLPFLHFDLVLYEMYIFEAGHFELLGFKRVTKFHISFNDSLFSRYK